MAVAKDELITFEEVLHFSCQKTGRVQEGSNPP